MKNVESLKTPGWWQRIQYVNNPIGYFESAVSSHPEAFWAKGIDFGTPVTIFYTPEAARQIIENRDRSLATTTFASEVTAILGNNSFFTLEGARHQSMRKLLMPVLHGKHIRSYGSTICDIADKTMHQLPTNQPFSAMEAAQNITMEVAIAILFGVSEGERYQQIKHLMSSLLNIFASGSVFGVPLFFRFLQQDLGLWSPWKKLQDLLKQIEELLYTEIAERRDCPNSERKDVLSLLLSASDEEGCALSDREIVDQLLSLLFAGNDATAATIVWAWYLVHRHPEIKTKLIEEIDSLGNSPDPVNVAHLPYLSAVCNEILRLYPVTIFTIPLRVSVPTAIADYKLEPGTLVSIGIYQIHYREDIYPEPQRFKPERFIDRKFSPFEFLPFGGGMRSCMGGELANYQIKLTLATILSRYELALRDNKLVLPQRRNTILAPISLKMIKKNYKCKSNV
jgi:cytochrome P450 family 110